MLTTTNAFSFQDFVPKEVTDFVGHEEFLKGVSDDADKFVNDVSKGFDQTIDQWTDHVATKIDGVQGSIDQLSHQFDDLTIGDFVPETWHAPNLTKTDPDFHKDFQ